VVKAVKLQQDVHELLLLVKVGNPQLLDVGRHKLLLQQAGLLLLGLQLAHHAEEPVHPKFCSRKKRNWF
jgi:hypothetical protein